MAGQSAVPNPDRTDRPLGQRTRHSSNMTDLLSCGGVERGRPWPSRRLARGPCHAPVKVREWTRPRAVSRHECLQTESSGTEQRVDRTVQVAAAPDSPPRRRQARLPRSHAGVGSPSVLDEEQLALGPQHASHLPQGPNRVRHRPEGPRGDHRVGDPVAERDRLGLPSIHSTAMACRAARRFAIRSSGPTDRARRAARPENRSTRGSGQSPRRSRPRFRTRAARSAPARQRPPGPHGEMDQPGQDVSLVGVHGPPFRVAG